MEILYKRSLFLTHHHRAGEAQFDVNALLVKTTKEKKIYIQKVKTIAILLIFFDIKAYNIKDKN